MVDSGSPQYYPPPCAPYPPAVTCQPVVVPVALGPHKQLVQCPSCHATVTTRVETEASSRTHLIAVILCCVSCCCCLPYLIDSCQDTVHYCPNCKAYIGKH